MGLLLACVTDRNLVGNVCSDSTCCLYKETSIILVLVSVHN